MPLHIFEERYKLMIGECLDEEREFGIVWLSDDGLRETGCAARITQVLERIEDGRMNILVQGTGRSAWCDGSTTCPTPPDDVELLEDDELDEEAPAPPRRRARRYADLVERVTDARPDDEELGRARRLRDGRDRRRWPWRPSRSCWSCAPSARASSSSRGCSPRR